MPCPISESPPRPPRAGLTRRNLGQRAISHEWQRRRARSARPAPRDTYVPSTDTRASPYRRRGPCSRATLSTTDFCVLLLFLFFGFFASYSPSFARFLFRVHLLPAAPYERVSFTENHITCYDSLTVRFFFSALVNLNFLSALQIMAQKRQSGNYDPGNFIQRSTGDEEIGR